MGLELRNISLVEGGEDWISDVSVTFGSGINVLVGTNLAGKTTLMRITVVILLSLIPVYVSQRL